MLQEIRKHNTLIIIGETGSGKTTQIPQLLLEGDVAGSQGCIGVTQPRRIAAVSVAQRVAQERNVKTGTLVGYSVRFEECMSEKTRIKFLTDGMMVREAMTDEVLSDYSVVILDEAHERSVNLNESQKIVSLIDVSIIFLIHGFNFYRSVQTDVLLGVTRRAQNLRKLKNLPPLKLIIMSATMDVDKFADYFQAPAIYIEGRQHPVRIFHATKQQDDYAFAALVTAFQIHREAPPTYTYISYEIVAHNETMIYNEVTFRDLKRVTNYKIK